VRQVTQTFEVRGSPSQVWGFVSHMPSLLSCVPGVEEVITSRPEEAVVRVRAELGYLSKVFEVTAKITEKEPMKHLTFAAQSEHFSLLGRLAMETTQDGNTLIRYGLEADAVSPFGKALLMMGGEEFVSNQAASFATCLANKLPSAPRG